MFRRITGRKDKAAPPPPVRKETSGTGLVSLVRQGIKLQADREVELRQAISEGLEFYNAYNDSRLQLAFDSFDPEMRKALFELIYLLHVNDRSMEDVHYMANRIDDSYGIPRTVQVEATANLFVDGAPAGVRGLDEFSEVFKGEFEQFVQVELGKTVPRGGQNGSAPIVCLQSIGSIGTVGHKSGSSDLDLQVVYDLTPSMNGALETDDDGLRDALRREHGWWMSRIMQQHKLTPAHLKNPDVKKRLSAKATDQISKIYPSLYQFLMVEKQGYMANLMQPQNQGLRSRVANELMALIKNKVKLESRERIRKDEALLQQRVDAIQSYITEKYPTAEIYCFTCALERYRAGRYTSSLEFKESSGSAYELILNYETLMPGIQFSSTIPSHFIFPKTVNDDPATYQRLNTYVDFGSIDLYQDVGRKLVDLGHTPDLSPEYVAEHRGAVYWEAFKASSGNLPKATLNLLRYEMLLDERFRHTIMQLVKQPKTLDGYVSPKSQDERQRKRDLENSDAGLPNWVLLEMEAEHPMLLQDPWWLRYKALKIGFGERKGVHGLEPIERNRASKTVDLAFALHVRISDVFTKPGDTRPLDSHREQVLVRFLKDGFPTGTPKREYLQLIFAGETNAVNRFEGELRANFRMSLERTQQKVARFNVSNLRKSQSEELKLWYQYYEAHFEPKPHVVQKTIMNHLQFSRGRVQVGYRVGEGWYFKSLQRQSTVGKRFDTFGVLSHLPEEIMLIEGTAFLYGLATCISNGYYGILNQGSLKESRTALEFDGKYLDMGSALDNEAAFIRPDHIDRILDRILEFFPYEYHHYVDFIRAERRVNRVFLFYNLWKFGRLSILYRDTLGTWYCEEFDHIEIEKNSTNLRKDHAKMLGAPPLHATVDEFLRKNRVYIDDVELAVWVNPNSTETTHPGYSIAQKEGFLNDAFMKTLLQNHPSKSGVAARRKIS